ncbi:MAG: hypothetical protein FJ030_18910 [Chloroflexi bacterium]|nr:hypothetical protein [Chloroflexota bacterium]
MGLSEADTRAELIDPIIRGKGWMMPYVRREESGKRVDIVGGQPRQSRIVHLDYVLRVEVNAETQPVAVAILEAKAEDWLIGNRRDSVISGGRAFSKSIDREEKGDPPGLRLRSAKTNLTEVSQDEPV